MRKVSRCRLLRVVVACTLVVAAGGAASGGAEGAGSALPRPERVFPALGEILRDALDQSPRLVSRNLERLQAAEMTAFYSSRQYPRVDSSLQFNLQRDDRQGLTSPVSSEKLFYDFRVSQPLFHWGALRAGAEIGRIQAAIAADNLVEAYRLLALEVRAAYLQLVIHKRAVANQHYELELAEKRRELVKARADAGEVPGGDVAAAGFDVEERQLNLERSERAFATALRQFRRLSGATSFDASVVPDEIPAIEAVERAVTHPFRVNFVEKRGFEETVRYAVAEKELERERLQGKISRTNLRPKLDLAAGLYQDELSYTLDVSRRDRIESLYVGVRVQWNIFDGLSTRGLVRANAARVRQLEHQLGELEEDLVNAVADAAEELGFSRRTLAIAERRYNGSKGGLAFAEEEFKAGRVAETDVDAARLGELNGRVAVFQARAAYMSALATFLSLANADPAVDAAAESIHKR